MKSLARPADASELVVRLRELSPASTRRWGRMTVHQMVCHLGDAFGMAMGEKVVIETSNVLGRTVVKWVALYAPMRWPSGISTSPELDQCAAAGTTPGDFAADVAHVQAAIERMAREAGAMAAWPRHPVFGRMSLGAWLRWGYLHVDHHLRQFGA